MFGMLSQTTAILTPSTQVKQETSWLQRFKNIVSRRQTQNLRIATRIANKSLRSVAAFFFNRNSFKNWILMKKYKIFCCFRKANVVSWKLISGRLCHPGLFERRYEICFHGLSLEARIFDSLRDSVQSQVNLCFKIWPGKNHDQSKIWVTSN